MKEKSFTELMNMPRNFGKMKKKKRKKLEAQECEYQFCDFSVRNKTVKELNPK